MNTANMHQGASVTSLRTPWSKPNGPIGELDSGNRLTYKAVIKTQQKPSTIQFTTTIVKTLVPSPATKTLTFTQLSSSFSSTPLVLQSHYANYSPKPNSYSFNSVSIRAILSVIIISRFSEDFRFPI